MKIGKGHLTPSIEALIPRIDLTNFEKGSWERGSWNTERSGCLFGDGFDEMFSLDHLKYHRYQNAISSYVGELVPFNKKGNYDISNEEVVRIKVSFLDKLKSQTIVDLGCGFNLNGYQIARRCGFGAYVGVDVSTSDGRLNKENWSDEKIKIARWMVDDTDDKNYTEGVSRFCYKLFEEYPRERYDPIPACLVHEDMLTFLNRLPNESVSVMANGIDTCIISGRYREEVRDEVYRVLHPEGLFLTDDLFSQKLESLCIGKMLYAKKAKK